MLLTTVLEMAGISRADFDKMIGNAKDAIKALLDDPKTFLSNLIEAVKGGFTQFKDNFSTHFKNGVIGWLTGSLNGVVIPKKWNSKGVFTLAVSVLVGKTTLFGQLLKNNWKRQCRWCEESQRRYQYAKSSGWEGLWDNDIGGYVNNIADGVLDSLTSYLRNRVLIAAVTKLASMFNPVGAIVQGLLTAYRIYQFIGDKFKQMFELVSAIFENLNAIAQGSIQGAINGVESVLGKGLTLGIDLLARILGLGKLTNAVNDAIDKIRKNCKMPLIRWSIYQVQTGINKRQNQGQQGEFR